MASRRIFRAAVFASLAAFSFLSCGAGGKPVDDKVIIQDFVKSEFKYQKMKRLVNMPSSVKSFDMLEFPAAYDEIVAAIPGGDLKMIDASPRYQNDYRELSISRDSFKKELLASLYGRFNTYFGRSYGSYAGHIFYAAAVYRNDIFFAFNSLGNAFDYKNPPKVVNYAIANDKKSFSVELEFPSSGWDLVFYRYWLLSQARRISYDWGDASATAANAGRILVEDNGFHYNGAVFKVTYKKKDDKAWEFVKAEKQVRLARFERENVPPPEYNDEVVKAMGAWKAETDKSKAESAAAENAGKVSAGEQPSVPANAVKAVITIKETGEKVAVSVAASESIAPDSEGSYGVVNLFDGDPKTAWCPKGEHGSLTVYFDKPRTINGIGVANGFQRISQKGTDLFSVNSRVDMLGVTNDRGKGWAVKLGDDRNGVVRYQFESSMTDPSNWENVWSLRFEIVNSYAGSSSKDVLLSELEF